MCWEKAVCRKARRRMRRRRRRWCGQCEALAPGSGWAELGATLVHLTCVSTRCRAGAGRMRYGGQGCAGGNGGRGGERGGGERQTASDEDGHRDGHGHEHGHRSRYTERHRGKAKGRREEYMPEMWREGCAEEEDGGGGGIGPLTANWTLKSAPELRWRRSAHSGF